MNVRPVLADQVTPATGLRLGVAQHPHPVVAEMPGGGFEHSGYGKDLSPYSLDDRTRVEYVMTDIDA